MATPWTIVESLQRWTAILEEHLSRPGSTAPYAEGHVIKEAKDARKLCFDGVFRIRPTDEGEGSDNPTSLALDMGTQKLHKNILCPE